MERALKETIPAFLQVLSLEKTCIVIQKEKAHNPFFVQKPLILFHWQYFTSITFTKVERLSKPTRHLTFTLFQKSGEITCWKEKWEETGPVFSHLSGTVTPCYFQRFKHTHKCKFSVERHVFATKLKSAERKIKLAKYSGVGKRNCALFAGVMYPQHFVKFA